MWLFSTINTLTRTAFEKRAIENKRIIRLIANDSAYTFELIKDNGAN